MQVAFITRYLLIEKSKIREIIKISIILFQDKKIPL